MTLRSVSDETPNSCAVKMIAAHCEACSSWCSNTSLAARSRSWAELFTRRRPYDCSLD